MRAIDLRKSIDGLALIVETQIKKDSYQNALPKSLLGSAFEYAKELLSNMCFILEDGHLEIDYNL